MPPCSSNSLGTIQFSGWPHLQAVSARPSAKNTPDKGAGSFSLWAPRVFKYYQEHLDLLFAHLPHLRRNFKRSIFCCATVNFGPNVWTYKHRDSLNCPFGWCAIQALGDFNPTKGGHLILWEAKLIVEFPASSTIHIPSATITHSNVPVQHGEQRASFIQYCSGGIFQLVDNGYQTKASLAASDPVKYSAMLGLKETRWTEGLALLSTVDELLESVNI